MSDAFSRLDALEVLVRQLQLKVERLEKAEAQRAAFAAADRTEPNVPVLGADARAAVNGGTLHLPRKERH